MPTSRPLAVLVLAASLTALAGCAAGPSELTRSAEPASELDAYLGEIFDLDDEAAAAEHAVDEEAIAVCMAEAGFEYRPQAPPRQYPWPDPLTPEFAAEFGYGETTETLGPDVPPSMWSHSPGQDPAVDFNESYVGSLSADAREEYFLALNGPYLDPGEEPDGEPAEPDSCRDRAYARYRTPQGLEELETAIREEIWWVDQDARVAATLPAWSSCMADAGYPGLTLVEEAAGLVADRVNRSSLSVMASWDELRAKNAEELAELQRFEVDVAVADSACREQTGWYDVRAEVLADAKASVLERYRPELDAWLEHERGRRAASAT